MHMADFYQYGEGASKVKSGGYAGNLNSCVFWIKITLICIFSLTFMSHKFLENVNIWQKNHENG